MAYFIIQSTYVPLRILQISGIICRERLIYTPSVPKLLSYSPEFNIPWCVSCFDKELCMEVAVIVFCDQPVGGFVQQFHRTEWSKTCSMEAGNIPHLLGQHIFCI